MPRVYNKHHGDAPPDAVYIGRPSRWGNDFKIGRDGTRDEVCDKHEQRLLRDPELLRAVKRELAGRDLVCFCAPLRCHGDTLLRIANAR